MPTNVDLGVRTAEATEESALLPQAKREERGHVVSVRESVAAGGTLNLNLRNPTDNDHNANIQLLRVSTQFEAVVDVFDTYTTAPSGGTTPAVDNLLMDTAQDNGGGSMTIRKNADFDGDNLHVVAVMPGGGSAGKVGGTQSQTAPLVEPDREIVMQVTNQSGSANDAALTIVWVEEPRDA